jgi:2-polyprenyl-6-methoxyphenol hydroxylase-like FAD-dependent oxidoreductase
MTDTQRDRRTALIIGGGIAGPVLAVALRRAGIAATVYEARRERADHTGSWLALMPNGVNALETLGIDGVLEQDAIPVRGIAFHNAAGKRLGEISREDDASRYGAGTVIVKRWQLHRALHEEAQRQGIPIVLGMPCTEIAASDDGVTARFADGSTATADFLAGCDGIHSLARQFVAPYALPPTYTGIAGFGGFSRPTPPLPFTGEMETIFGRRAFAAFFVTPSGEVYWFDNLPWPREPTREELEAVSDAERRAQLLHVHRDDLPPFAAIVHATEGEIGTWIIHDLPPLPVWHRGPVCLVGDAAHATAPHGAQGASLALEDAVVLAKCLRDLPTLDEAFATYQGMRKERVERQVRQARRTGQQNLVRNPIALWLRDRLLPVFLKRGAGATDWLFDERIDWDAPVIPARDGARGRRPRPLLHASPERRQRLPDATA